MRAFPQKKFMQAVSAYQEKKFSKAKVICAAILKDTPDHAACLHLMGVAEYNLGHMDEAEILIRKSLDLNPCFAEMHYSFAKVLAAHGKHNEALAEYKRTLELKPQHADAYYGLGKTFRALGQLQQAMQAYRQAINVKPDYAEVLNSIGILFYEQRRFVEAIDSFESALTVRPEFPEVLNNLGASYIETREFLKATECCEQAIALQSDYAEAFNNLGNAFREQGKWAEARRCFERTLELAPDMLEARNNLGLVFLDGYSDSEAAAGCFRKIMEQDHNHIGALTHLGIISCHNGAFAEGIELYDKVLALQPDYRDALNNLGTALNALGRTQESIEVYERVVAAQPEDPNGHNNLAMSLLTAGRFDEGWREYEWRWQATQLAAVRRDFSQRQWNGEAAVGMTLLIHAEQGFGDTLQFCRYASLVAARGMNVILEVQPELVRLIYSLSGVKKVVGRGNPLPSFDLHCPMMSLPLAFGTKVETIPSGSYWLNCRI